jgi:hypothetical protein
VSEPSKRLGPESENRMSTRPEIDGSDQLGLFDSGKATVAEILREQLAKARSESERARIKAELQALSDIPF